MGDMPCGMVFALANSVPNMIKIFLGFSGEKGLTMTIRSV
jgi:hypothetical protein